MTLISLRAYAKHRGVSLKAVQKAIESGRIQTVPDEKGREKIDATDSDRRWDKFTDPSKQRNQKKKPPIEPSPEISIEQVADFSQNEADIPELPEDGEHDFYKAKAMREAYLARIAKLNYLQRSKELIESKEIEIEWQKLITAAKTRLLSVPSKLRSRIPHLTAADMAAIDLEIREALLELSRGGSDE